jgi:hypothetical protein
MPIWRENAHSLTTNKKLVDTYFTVLRKFGSDPGACHISSATLYVMLREMGFSPELCIGEVTYGNTKFDHSWVELDGLIFDVAVVYSLEEYRISNPVFSGINLGTITPTEGIYISTEPTIPDKHTLNILKKGFLKYMDEYPVGRNGIWAIVKELGRDLNKNWKIAVLKDKYSSAEWSIRTPYIIQGK